MAKTQKYFRVDGSVFGLAVGARGVQRWTARNGGRSTMIGQGTPLGMVDGGVVVAVTGALAGRVALTGG